MQFARWTLPEAVPGHMVETSTGLPRHDVAIVRELANQVAEIAALPVQHETIRLWEKMNGLAPERPMAMIDELPWHEMEVNDELTVVSTDPFTRELETRLRRTLYRWNNLRVDMVVRPSIEFQKVINHSGWGIRIEEDTIEVGDGNTILSHHYEDQLADPEDIQMLRLPEVSLNVGKTAEVERRPASASTGAWGSRCRV